MKYPITIDSLEVLDAIARKGSFAAAANELYRVPSAISYTIQKLEQDLDVVLFRKEGRKAVLTEAGKILMEQGREILQATERLAIATKKTYNGWEPVINIAIDSILDFEFIYPLIDKFYYLQPEIEINIFEEVLGGASESIIAGRADLVIGANTTVSADPNIQALPIQQIEWVFAVASGHELITAPHPLTLATIENYRFVVVRDSSRIRAPENRRMLSKCPVISVPTLAEKIRAQCLGLGVGFLPKHRIQHHIKQGFLTALPLVKPIPVESIAMAWKKKNDGKVLQWFVEQVTKHRFD